MQYLSKGNFFLSSVKFKRHLRAKWISTVKQNWENSNRRQEKEINK